MFKVQLKKQWIQSIKWIQKSYKYTSVFKGYVKYSAFQGIIYTTSSLRGGIWDYKVPMGGIYIVM